MVGVSTPRYSRSLYQRYTAHERALYFNSTIIFSEGYVRTQRIHVSTFVCVDPLKYFQFCELKVYETFPLLNKRLKMTLSTSVSSK